jgi:glycerophosphoryl diester phosphodiesterase
MREAIQFIYSVFFAAIMTTTVLGGPEKNMDPGLGITAHRGNSSQFPENTIPAFQSAINLQVDWAELDIHQTKDGKLVVIHDASTGQVGDRDMVIAAHTYEELKVVDVAHGFRKKYNLTPAQCPSQAIPLLEEVLVLFSKSSQTKISIQPKADCVKPAVDMVKKLNMTEKVGFNDGNLKYMSTVKDLAPAIRVFWDRPHDSDIEEDIRIARSRKFDALVINEKGITPEKIQKVKAAGIEIGAWTVNDTETMRRLIQLGIQRIYTDEPQKLKILQNDLETVFCEGTYKQHLQGICVDNEGNIFWSWTDRLVKTDARGKILASIAAASHHGDLCVVGGNLYVAVNLGKFNESDHSADSWVYQYDSHDLREIRRIPVPELVYGAGGIAYHKEKFIVVGGLPIGEADNIVYEYDQEFKFQKRHFLKSGYTKMGIQTIAYGDHSWWLGCYGDTPVTLQLNEDLSLLGKHQENMSLGVAVLKNGSLLVGNNTRTPLRGHSGYVQKKNVRQK